MEGGHRVMTDQIKAIRDQISHLPPEVRAEAERQLRNLPEFNKDDPVASLRSLRALMGDACKQLDKALKGDGR